MALTSQSLFLYGFQVTASNASIDFVRVAAGPELQATLQFGFYSLTGLIAEIKRAMEAVDLINTYTVSVDRTISGGTENRVTISTSGTFLTLKIATGTRSASSFFSLIGFPFADKTGATSYTGNASAGTSLLTNSALPYLTGYSFLPPDFLRRNFGSLNISSSGLKEAVVFSVQRFWQVQFKFITKTEAFNEWSPLLTWMMLQREIEFTPEVSVPGTFYVGTMDQSSEDGKGLAFRLSEMLPQYPNFFDTGLMKFRVRS